MEASPISATHFPPRAIRFGAFEADLRDGELRKDGVKLKFGGQPFQVLAILLGRPGEVVTREELQKRLWPDTFVDVERNLNTAINKIREVLGDSAETPHFIETLPRRGYRFIGELEPTIQAGIPEIKIEPDRDRHDRAWVKIGAGLLAIAVIALAFPVAYRWRRQQQSQEQPVLTAVPFTALPGLAANPAFSPDGSRIAFAWSPGVGTDGLSQSDLYVKAVGSETRLRLTEHPSSFLSPAWSPDGTQIAFYRRAGAESGIYLVPALGGPEQKLRSTQDLGGATITWSPDGKWIAFEDMDPYVSHKRINLLSPETLAIRETPDNPMCSAEVSPAFSHNGEYLAYWCFRDNYEAAIYSFLLPDGKPKLIAPILDAIDGLAWSADDKKLVYSGWKGMYSVELGEVSVVNGSVKRLGLEGMWPAVSSNGKLAYGSHAIPAKLWRRDLLHPEAPPLEIIPSSRPQYDAQYSPDGRHIVFASSRSGRQGVWLSDADGGNLVQISDPSHVSGSPQWSPDGSKIVFDSFPGDHWAIYVADLAERKPRKLTTNILSTVRPSWSRDGKWVYFVSHKPGMEGVYRCPASGGDAIALSKNLHGSNPRESFDGKTLYFAAEEATLRQVALTGQSGTESEVDRSLRVFNWALTPGGIYFVPADARRSVRYFEFASKRIRTVFEAESDIGFGLSVSPDGRWGLYSQEGDETGDIMLVDHFH
jgi:Tol biopolymer transport system component/DNA-binding winged helix-turn-helix (wHTH) protein